MSSLNEAIKTIVQNYIRNMSLSNLVYGTYTNGGLKLDNKPVPIDSDMVIVPQSLKKYKAKVSFSLNAQECESQLFLYSKGGARIELEKAEFKEILCTIEPESLKSGDKVAVVQAQGGQRYYITDRL